MRTSNISRGRIAAAVLSFFLLSIGPAAAAAAAPPFLLQIPEAGVVPGSGAAQLENPRGIAADPISGRIYVSERNNARISEYTAWGLFVKAWGWGVADGSAEPQSCGPTEPEFEPPSDLCREGILGAGEGQFKFVTGLAVDAGGNVYAFDVENLRVQKFDSEGNFLLMFGGNVNRTKAEAGAPASERNVCPVAPGDVCQAGGSGSEEGRFTETPGNYLDYIAYSPVGGGAIVVGDKGRIQVFNLDGTFRQQIKFEGPLAAFTGKAVSALEVDSLGNIYFALVGVEDVYKVSPTGDPVSPGKPGETSFRAEAPRAIAVAPDHAIWVIDDPLGATSKALKFDSAGAQLVPTPAEEATEDFFPYKQVFGLELTGIATNLCAGSENPGNVYIASQKIAEIAAVDAYGTPPIGCEPPPKRPPDIVDTLTTSVAEISATVRAQINPKFWADTTYYVQYGTGKCSEGGCPASEPTPPGETLTDEVVSVPLATSSVGLAGLAPRTTYRYRFVAQSGGGGPVFGPERTFTTFPKEPGPPPGCPPRTERSARLPNCRAYELVSPLDKEGRDVGMLGEERFIERNQSAPSGELFAFSSFAAFVDPESGPYVSQYLASRTDDGWASEAISPPRTNPSLPTLAGLSNEFKGFSEDLCQAWFQHNSVARLTSDAVSGYPNLYRRVNCAKPPAYDAITTVQPPERQANEYFPSLKGFSDDGSHTFFTAEGKLHPDAPVAEAGELRLYERLGDETRFVCYLPDGTPYSGECAAGTLAGISGPDMSSLHNAISADGSRIFWTAYNGTKVSKFAHPGRLYVRIDGTRTVAVSESVSSDPAFFWTATGDGSKVIFEFVEGARKGELYEFDVDSETPTLISKGVEGPMGASEDLSRVYFASSEDLDGVGPASKGGHNLYLYDATANGGAGAFTFIMALSAEDIGGFSVTVAGPARPIHRLPPGRGAAVTPDGAQATFMSVASPTPTGYDNRDSNSGKPAAEVYRYDAAAGDLRCISCNPTGARPTGMAIVGSSVAARIQGWEMNFHAPRVISEDGSRIFFESFEALVGRDTNETWDVYQWEELGKGGVAGCSEDRHTFSAETAGCVDLISSGKSPERSVFLDADRDGESIFFSTQSSLVGRDPGLNDVYVARVNGGFSEPVPRPICVTDCQRPAPAPAQPVPSSRFHRGDDDLGKKPRSRRCKRGFRKVRRAGKVRCIKRRGVKAGKRGTGRRAS